MTTYITYDANADSTGLVNLEFGEWSHTMDKAGYVDITNKNVINLYNHLKPGDEVYVCEEGTYNLLIKK